MAPDARGRENHNVMRIFIYIVMACFSQMTCAQIVEISSADQIDWDNLTENEDATFCVFDAKTGILVELKHYKNGKKHGLFLFSGTVLGDKISYVQSNYRKGVLHGFYKDLEESGIYKNGKKDGAWERRSDDGSYEKAIYKKDLKHGVYLKKDGEFKIEGSYKNGKKDGVWNVYDKSGTLSRIEEYKCGQLVVKD